MNLRPFFLSLLLFSTSFFVTAQDYSRKTEPGSFELGFNFMPFSIMMNQSIKPSLQNIYYPEFNFTGKIKRNQYDIRVQLNFTPNHAYKFGNNYGFTILGGEYLELNDSFKIMMFKNMGSNAPGFRIGFAKHHEQTSYRTYYGIDAGIAFDFINIYTSIYKIYDDIHPRENLGSDFIAFTNYAFDIKPFCGIAVPLNSKISISGELSFYGKYVWGTKVWVEDDATIIKSYAKDFSIKPIVFNDISINYRFSGK